MNKKPIQIVATFKASPATIWKAITDKNKMNKWYFDIPDFELKKGAVFNFYEPGTAKRFHHQCIIKEIVFQKKFQHTWTYPNLSKGNSLVTWELQKEQDSTKVILTHTGVENFADGGDVFYRESFVAGWKEIVTKMLANYLNSIA